MSSLYLFADPRLGKLDGFAVEIDEAHERADIVLNRPPYNVVSMPQRDQLRLVFETLDEDARVRIIVVRSVGEHFSSGGNIGGFMEASPETVSKLAWNIASPTRCAGSPEPAGSWGRCARAPSRSPRPACSTAIAAPSTGRICRRSARNSPVSPSSTISM